MKHSNKILVIVTAAMALAIYATASIVYADSSNNNSTQHSQFYFKDGKTINGNKQIVSTVKFLPHFNSINIAGLANVIVQKGDKNEVTISTDENLLPYMKIDVKNNQLNIGSKRNINLNPTQAMSIIITSKSLNFNNISTAGKIKFTAENINANKLNVKIGGDSHIALSGNVKKAALDLAGRSHVSFCDINATDINFNTAGKSTIYLCGHANNLTLKSAGKSDIAAKDFTAENLVVLGAGDINVTSRVLKTIHVTAFGKVQINYYGNPKTINKTAFGNVILQKIGA